MTVVEIVSAVGLIADPRSTLREQGIGRHMPQAWALSNGYVRKIVATVAALLVILATLVAIPIATPGLTAGAERAVDASCGLDLVFVLDESGSMGENSNQGLNAVIGGVDSVVAALAGSASNIGLVKFSVGADSKSMTPVGSLGDWDAGWYNNPSGRTSWWDGLKAGAAFPQADALILITDGDPNVDSNEGVHGPPPAVPYSHSTAYAGNNLTAAHTVPMGTAVKNQHTKVYGIGAGRQFGIRIWRTRSARRNGSAW